MTANRAPDYLAIGHITVDLYPGNIQHLGGSALYAALAAARSGLRAAIMTRGNFQRHGDQVADALQRFAGEVEIIVQSADNLTVFTNETVMGRRHQTLHSWAGPIDLSGLPPYWRSARIIHLAPVAQEVDPRRAGQLSPEYFGVTPQGWIRAWNGRSGPITLVPLRLPSALLSRIDALVVSSEERAYAREAIKAIGSRGLAVITRGVDGANLVDRGLTLNVPAYPVPTIDDLGAGDVFAAVLFLMRASHDPTAAAARAAAAAAALRVQSVGPNAVPTRADVQEFLRTASTDRLRKRGR
jgi:sugar/nucleoside kinase (ribokinase family)